MRPEQKAALLKFLDDFMDGDMGVRDAHVRAEEMLLAALGDAEITAKWIEASNWWWYA